MPNAVDRARWQHQDRAAGLAQRRIDGFRGRRDALRARYDDQVRQAPELGHQLCLAAGLDQPVGAGLRGVFAALGHADAVAHARFVYNLLQRRGCIRILLCGGVAELCTHAFRQANGGVWQRSLLVRLDVQNVQVGVEALGDGERGVQQRIVLILFTQR